MTRVFSAIDVEDSETLNQLREAMKELNHGFKAVPPEKMHLTFQFFQDVDENEIEKVKEAMNNVKVSPFNATIKEIGAFPSKKYIRVLWAGVEADPLYTLKEQLSNHEVADDNNHNFRPHITLFRVDNLGRTEKKEVHKALESYQDKKISEFEVSSVKLFESQVTNNGSTYRELFEKELSREK